MNAPLLISTAAGLLHTFAAPMTTYGPSEWGVTVRHAEPGWLALPYERRWCVPSADGATVTYFALYTPVEPGAALEAEGIVNATWAGPADVNLDGFIDGLDYDAFVQWTQAGDARADFNQDGFIDGLDYDAFMREWGG